MSDPAACFPVRIPGDALDVAPLVRRRLDGPGGEILLSFEGRPVTAAALREQVAGCCAALARRGLRPGDRVAVMLSNSPEHIALVYALVLSGLVWIPVNTRLRADGVAYILEHAKPALLVAGPELRAALPPTGVPCLDVAELAAADGGAIPDPVLPHAGTLCVIYTSGTTGAPKGVLFTHRMMRIAAESVLLAAGIGAGDRAFLWEPLCHIGGAQMLMVPFLVPATLFVVRRFSATRFWEEWTAARATHLHYLGGILDILVRLPEAARPPGARVGIAWGAGASAASWEAVRARLGCELRECYGMTECSSFATVNASGKPGSIGRPLPWFSMALLGPDGQEVAPGGVGEIVLASGLEGVFLPGYLDDPQATARALRDGRLHTGDLARQDADGDYVFVGRRSDSMRVRGENVSAWEVERVFAQHPAIEAAAAIGVAGEIGEQDIALFVQWKAGAAAGAAMDWPGLREWAAPRLAPFQQPRFYQAVTDFPLTPSQRIQKHRLVFDRALAWDARADGRGHASP